MIILCDTDVIIEFYKNNRQIVFELEKIGENGIAISPVTIAELFYGALNKKELQQINKDVNSLKILGFNPEIGETLLFLMSKYSLANNLKIPDAIIAATAIVNNVELFTLNVRDFRFIKELKQYHFNKS
jgi:hypothetical protein